MNVDVRLDQGLWFISEDLWLEALEHEDQTGVGITALVATVVALDIEDGLFPSIDSTAVKLRFGGFDALGITNFIALQLGVFEPVSQLWAFGEFEVEQTFTDTLLLDGWMGVAALYQIIQYTLEQRDGELALGRKDGGRSGLVGGRLRHEGRKSRKVETLKVGR